MALSHAFHGVQNVSAHCLTKVGTVLKSGAKIAFLSLNVASLVMKNIERIINRLRARVFYEQIVNEAQPS